MLETNKIYNEDMLVGIKKIPDESENTPKRVFQKNMFNAELDKGLTEKEYIWKYYYITPNGRVFRRCDNRELKVSKISKGYMAIRLPVPLFSTHKDGRKCYRVHRLVAMYYLPNYSEYLQINHKNGIKTDNRVENLEMCTNSENAYHAWNCLNSTKRRQLASLNGELREGRKVNVYFANGAKLSYPKLCIATKKVLNITNYQAVQKACKERRIYRDCLFVYADEQQPTKEEVIKMFDTHSASNHWLFEYYGKRYNLKELSKQMRRERHCLIADIKAGKYPEVKIIHYAN